MRVAFVWQGFGGRFGAWADGLQAAMKLIERQHDVLYLDVDQIGRVYSYEPDVVLYWEAPCTANGKNALYYDTIRRLPFKKALLFAGGPVKKEWCAGFDLFFVESRISEEEFGALGLPWRRAFGVNTQVMKSERQPKAFDGVFQCTSASWKRPWLMAEALGAKSAVFGRFQEEDPQPFVRSRELGALLLPELPANAVAAMLNASHTVVNCSEFWGGGQRSTLEGMACGTPVIVMSDSPKNREYVEESGAGLVCEPDANSIRRAVEEIKGWTPAEKARGVAYVQSKWTERRYADAILEGVASIL